MIRLTIDRSSYVSILHLYAAIYSTRCIHEEANSMLNPPRLVWAWSLEGQKLLEEKENISYMVGS